MTYISNWALFKQVVLATCASLGYMTIGLVRGYSSPGVPSMMKESPFLVPNQEVISWICAIPPLGAFLGSLLAGPLMEHLGRKMTLFLSAPFFTAAWLCIALSPDHQVLIASRALTGFCVGIVLPSAQLYVSECSHPKVRGMMGTLPALFLAVGILLAYTAGCWLPWKNLAFFSATFPATMFVLLIPLPESPAWLQLRGHLDKAAKARDWLCLNTNESETKKVKDDQIVKPKFISSSIMKPLGLVVGVMVLQQTCGIDVIIFYTVMIFHSSGSILSDHNSTVIVGGVQLIATLISLFLVDKFGRKPLLILSGLLMCISMISLGTYFHLQQLNKISNLGYIPLASLMVFIIGFSIGFSNVPFILMGELLPLSRRSILSAISGAANLGSMFLIIKTFPDLERLVGSDVTFWIYSGLSLFSCFFVGIFLPETKGKSFKEIEALFEPNCSENGTINIESYNKKKLEEVLEIPK